MGRTTYKPLNLKWVSIYISLTLALLIGQGLGCEVSGQPQQTVHPAAERKAIKDKIYSDTLLLPQNYGKHQPQSDKFYDTLYNNKSWFMRLVAPLLITSPRNASDEASPNPVLEMSRHYFREYSGCTITNIHIVQANVFTRDTSLHISGFEKFVDHLHIQTSEKVLRRNLLFRVGDTISPYKMSINEELLRSLPYLASSYIIVRRSPLNPREVSVSIFARDNWSISVDGHWGSESYGDLYDRNFLGTGDELRLRYYVPRNGQGHGFEGQYRFNNLFGTFMNVNLIAGVGSTNNTARMEASRPFILPSDHIWGFTAGYRQHNQSMHSMDSTMNIKYADYGLWYGYSWTLDPYQGTAVYGMVSSSYLDHQKRPDISTFLNPYYQDRFNVTASFGFSRQNYFQGNMIYGYGRTEDIPFGFKFEATGGYEWTEGAGRRAYGGLTALWGDMLGTTYLNLGVQLGSYWTRERKWEQSMIDVSARFFSPLFKLGDIYVRQFVNASATWGLGRFVGEKESISYTQQADMRGVGVPYNARGYNRATINAETVFFTPLFFYHFRFAFYLWGDVGVLGYDPAIFKNKLSSVVGIGVRVKNERLIFNNIQLRLGFILRQPDLYSFEMFSISNEQTFQPSNFHPTVPRPIIYQ